MWRAHFYSNNVIMSEDVTHRPQWTRVNLNSNWTDPLYSSWWSAASTGPTHCTPLGDPRQVLDRPIVLPLVTRGKYWTDPLYSSWWSAASTGPTHCTALGDARQVLTRPYPISRLSFNIDGVARLFTVSSLS